MRRWGLRISASCLCLAVVGSSAGGQGAGPLLKFTFDDDEGGWAATGTNARATITQQTSFNGRGSLKFEYDVKPGARSMLVLNTPNGLPAEGKTIKFWVSVDQPTSLAVLLQEKDGGRYSAAFAVPKGKWQEVALSVADFVLGEGPGDPKDPDDKLDLDRVGNVALVDVVQMLGAADNPEISRLLNVQVGARTLRLDDFLVTPEKLPTTWPAANGEVQIDNFVRPQAAWVGVGGVGLTRSDGATPAERGMQAVYRSTAGHIIALMRAVPRGTLAGCGRVSLTASSLQATTLIVQLEEAGGGKFSAPLTITQGGKAEPHTIDFAEFNAADDSKVKDRKVKPELVTQLVLLDVSGAMGTDAASDNVLRISNLRAMPGK